MDSCQLGNWNGCNYPLTIYNGGNRKKGTDFSKIFPKTGIIFYFGEIRDYCWTDVDSCGTIICQERDNYEESNLSRIV